MADGLIEIVKVGGAPAALVAIFLFFIWRALVLVMKGFERMNDVMDQDRKTHEKEVSENRNTYAKTIGDITGSFQATTRDLTETMRDNTKDMTEEMRRVRDALDKKAS